MSTKATLEKVNTNKNKAETEGDWENDLDDEWDDWDDAEDNNDTVEVEASKTITQTPHESQESLSNWSEPSAPTQQQQQQQQSSSSSSWWGGITSALSTASMTVSQGLNQVIGVPDPEELARIDSAESAKAQKSTASTPSGNGESDESATAFGKTLVSGVTTLGSKVLFTGLDTLEGIGKKTMHILQENDPQLKNKRKILGLETDLPNLSEVLKEAKKDAEEMENTLKALKISKNEQQLRFEHLFEQKCGLVHLEALDILSKESTLKLKTLIDAVSGRALSDLKETINEVKELMELEAQDIDSDGEYTAAELKDNLQTAIVDLELELSFDDMMNNWQNTLDWLTSNETADSQNTFAQGITNLAEICALSMNKLHKIAELLLVKDHHSTASEVDGIVQLCQQFIVHLHGVTHRFATKLTDMNDDEAKSKLNLLCAELLVAVQQIEHAFTLFVPIIQIGAA